MMALLAPLYWVLAAVIVLWNIQLAGRIARNRKAPRLLAVTSGMAGLLIAPALLAAAAGPSLLSGRAVSAIAWLWPAVTILFVFQTLHATLRRWVTPSVGIPFLLYNLVVAAVALARHRLIVGGDPEPWIVALGAAQGGALGILLGEIALFSPLALAVPLLSPVTAARWRLSATLRAGLAVFAAAWMALVVIIEYPRAYREVRAFEMYGETRLQERPAGDFVIGLHVFPLLRRLPTPLALANDLSLADSLDVEVVSITIAPEIATQRNLDSLARVLEDVRRDTTLLVVSLAYPRGARLAYQQSPERYVQARLLDLRRITYHLRPDVLLPAVEPYGQGVRSLGALPLDAWQAYLTAAADVIHEVRPRTRVGIASSSFDARDSALYAWAASRESPMDVVGFTFVPSFDGAFSLGARLAAADRWLRAADPARAPKPHWVFRTAGYPLVHGERGQRETIWGVLAWATARSQIRGVIVGDAADYERISGMRASGGRLRPAVPSVAQAVRLLRETAVQ